MLFCPKCGSLLILKKSGSKKVMACSCGYSTSDLANAAIREELGKKEKGVDVVEEEIETLPLTSAECPKCKHSRAYYWEVQTRAADEPATKFMKCEKCKHVWRDYS